MRVKTDLYLSIAEDADYEALEFKWKLFSCALEVPPDRQEHDRKYFYPNFGVRLTFLARRPPRRRHHIESQQPLQATEAK